MPGKILIADDQDTTRFYLKSLVEREFYTVIEARNGKEAIECARRERPDLILLDIEMPVLNGLDACFELKAHADTKSIPIIIVTAHGAQSDRNRGLKAGADDYLSRPVDPRILAARIRNLIRMKQLTDELELRLETLQSGFNVVLDKIPEIEDSALVVAANISQSLSTHFQQDHAPNETEALAAMANAEAIVVAEELPCGGSGLRLIAHIRASWENRHKVIIFIASSGDDAGLRALDLGASDYLLADFDLTELIIRINAQMKHKLYSDKLREFMDESIKNSVIDPLTGLHNRRYFHAYVPNLIAKNEKSGTPIAVMIMDIDHFKMLNDAHGHEGGDAVLSEVAERLRNCLRASDLIVRWGGEEFVVIVPNLARHMIEILAERLRISIQEKPFEMPSGEQVIVTCSIGVNFIEPNRFSTTDAMSLADSALYHAKSTGRNRVVFAET